VATDPPGDLQLDPLAGEPRTLAGWLTTFHLVVVVLDPYTYESAWLLDTAGRILSSYTGADCRPALMVTAGDDDTRRFLGPWTDRLLAFTDPDRTFVRACGLTTLPALVHINMAGAIEGVAEGWHPDEWRAVLARLSKVMSWTRPTVPGDGDPAPYDGSPALA
jgi:hypothetical protein